jgi:NAD(P)H-flavin reductase
MLPRLAYVVRKARETADTFTLEAAGTDGVAEFRFEPGQFHMIGLPGVGEVPISISGNPGAPRLLVHTLREVGAVTRALTNLKTNDEFTVRGPFGAAWPVKEAEGKDLVLVAGGIGLAPLRPVIYQVMAQRHLYGRFVLLYGTRSPDDILFRKELSQWRSSFDMDLSIAVDRSTGNWRGNVGVVTRLVPRAPFEPANSIAMVCGPEVMMTFAVEELLQRGVPDSSIYVSLERNMKCGIGLCGHCQLRGEFTCRTGPVYRFDKVSSLLEVREL